jgi:Protein of unknown function (DUF1800)
MRAKLLLTHRDKQTWSAVTGVVATVLYSFVLTGCATGTPAPTVANPPSPPGGTSASIAVAPATTTVATNDTDLFSVTQGSASVTGGQWVVLGGSSNGTIDTNGTFHAPSAVPTPAAISVGYVLSGETYIGTATVVIASATSNAVPRVQSVTPSVVSALTTSIQIAGTGFTALSIVTVNSIPVTTTYVNSTNLAAVVTLQAPVSTTLQIAVMDQSPATVLSNSITLPATFPTISVFPSQLAGGTVSLTVTGSNFAAGDVVLSSGVPYTTTLVSPTQLTAVGFLPPWKVGSAAIVVAAGDGTSPKAALTVPITPTAVSFDAAARFATQASFGPRPDVVQHIQQVGFGTFITEQFAQPAGTYPRGSTSYIAAAITGNSLLRQRVAYALQSFIVPHEQDFVPSATFFEDTLETDADANFRKLLEDVSSDPNIGTFLNLVGNSASTDPLIQPNQNFARELMQLFSLGPVLLNDDGSQQLDSSGDTIPTYSQDTVIALTRVFTGWVYPTPVNPADTLWGIDFSQPLAGNDSLHDHGTKVLFGTVQLPAGQSVLQDREMALDAIFNHPNLPPYISHILIQQLVTSNPSPAYIQRISNVFKNDGTGVRGNMGAVIRAILLDPEARRGDTTPSPSDGILQDPVRFQLFAMSALQTIASDDQPDYLAKALGENWWYAPTVFGFYSPTYTIPGTTITSPEFMLFNNLLAVQRSEVLWGIITAQQPGYSTNYEASSWLFNTFTTVPTMVDALNHLLYHGQMSPQEQAIIIGYCNGLNPFDVQLQLQSAAFLALNADSYNVSN